MRSIIYLHINNIVGISETLNQEQRKKGIISGFLDLPKEKTFFKRIKRRLKLFYISLKIIPHVDVIHFHYHTLLPFGLDLLLLKAMNKKIGVTY